MGVAHDVRDGLRRGSFEDPMAVVVEQAVAVDADVVQGGVFAHVGEGLLEVLGIAIDPLAAVATLGDGVELFGAEVTRFSHELGLAGEGPHGWGESIEWVSGGQWIWSPRRWFKTGRPVSK